MIASQQASVYLPACLSTVVQLTPISFDVFLGEKLVKFEQNFLVLSLILCSPD